MCTRYSFSLILSCVIKYATHDKKKHLKFIENLKRKATGRIFGLHVQNYHKRMQELAVPSIEYRKERGTWIELFKIGYNSYDPKATREKPEI